jgi:hypothetical protein
MNTRQRELIEMPRKSNREEQNQLLRGRVKPLRRELEELRNEVRMLQEHSAH